MGQFTERSELGIFEEPPAPAAQPTAVAEEAAPQAPEVVEQAVEKPETPKRGRKKADK